MARLIFISYLLTALIFCGAGVAILLLRNDMNLLGWILIIVGFCQVPFFEKEKKS